MRRQGLYIDTAGARGRGVYTKKRIPQYTIIEVAPVIVLSAADRKIVEDTKLNNYIFEWGDDLTQAVLGMGYVSMYNHSNPSNCDYQMDYLSELMTIRSVREIHAGEELTINYSGAWDAAEPVWFEDLSEKI